MDERVIIVDDNAAEREAAGETLERIGIKTTLLGSGQELLTYLQDNEGDEPDLILIDIFMPDMDGYETLQALREQQQDQAEIPVIFLADGQESETRGFLMGAKDFIRKPFEADELTGRVRNVLRIHAKMQRLEHNARVDHMTGFLNKDAIEGRMQVICQMEAGFLCVLDLDSFKLINDIYGHDTGDNVLVRFSELLKNNMRSEDICGRIGGDEFLLFAKNMRTEKELTRFTERINRDFIDMMEELLGETMKFPTGVSIGAAAVPAQGRDYRKLFHLADQALNMVKHSGKGSCALSEGLETDMIDPSGQLNLDTVTMILEERNISPSAMWMGREAFINIYRYMMRYMERYHGAAYRVLFTVTPDPGTVSDEHHLMITDEFRKLIQESLRNSDVMVEVSRTQIFLLLPETHEEGVHVVIDRLIRKWNDSEFHDRAAISWEAGPVRVHESHVPDRKSAAGAEHA